MLCFAMIRGSEWAMGWREINMNRRKPQVSLAVVPGAPGEGRQAAVLRKAASMALDVLRAQLPCGVIDSRFSPFLAGYLMGHARQVALKHGIDGNDDALSALAAELERQAAPLTGIGISGLQSIGGHAGSLVGRLEALCGTRHLLGQALVCGNHSVAADAGNAFLTDCDNAADPMQSRAPTMSLRFNAQERDVILAAFASFGTYNTTEFHT